MQKPLIMTAEQMRFILPTNILFVDIETIPAINPETMSIVPPDYLKRFGKRLKENETIEQHYADHAGLFAEHGKAVCISVGQMIPGKNKFYVKAYCSRDEKHLLTKFGEACNKPEIVTLAGHNIKEFDVPYLFRRFMINGMALPLILSVGSKKTWEYPFHDTMDMWGHTQWKYMASLDLVAEQLGLPSSKKDMSGADVAPVYYSMFDNVPNADLPFKAEDEVLGKIGTYGCGDIITGAHVYCRLKGFAPLQPDQILYSVNSDEFKPWAA